MMRTEPNSRQDQRGVALLLMLMIAALASALVLAMIKRQAVVQRELGAQLQHDQIAEYNRGAGFFAMAALRADAQNGLDVDHPGEFWAQPFPPFLLPGGMIQPVLRDAQARFNLNSLVDGNSPNPNALAYYRRLLNNLLLPPELADSLVDWLDSDSQPTLPGGGEDDYYLRQQPAYRASNRDLSTFSELRLVRGYNSQILRTLAPWVTVLPSDARTINVNFIPPGLLEPLVPGLSPTSAAALLQNRPLGGWRSVPEFLDNPVFNGLAPDVRQQVQSLLSVTSNYFELYTRVRVGERQRLQWALISRQGGRLAIIANERYPAWMPDSEAAPQPASTADKEGKR